MLIEYYKHHVQWENVAQRICISSSLNPYEIFCNPFDAPKRKYEA